jgi:hypothetical protein
MLRVGSDGPRRSDLYPPFHPRLHAEPVSEKVIRDIIAAAVQAPSAVNAQPCAFCVVRDRNVMAYKPMAPIIIGHPKSPPPPVAHKEPNVRWIG